MEGEEPAFPPQLPGDRGYHMDFVLAAGPPGSSHQLPRALGFVFARPRIQFCRQSVTSETERVEMG